MQESFDPQLCVGQAQMAVEHGAGLEVVEVVGWGAPERIGRMGPEVPQHPHVRDDDHADPDEHRDGEAATAGPVEQRRRRSSPVPAVAHLRAAPRRRVSRCQTRPRRPVRPSDRGTAREPGPAAPCHRRTGIRRRATTPVVTVALTPITASPAPSGRRPGTSREIGPTRIRQPAPDPRIPHQQKMPTRSRTSSWIMLSATDHSYVLEIAPFCCVHNPPCERPVLDEPPAGSCELLRAIGQQEMDSVLDVETVCSDRGRYNGDAMCEGLQDLQSGAAPDAQRHDGDIGSRQFGLDLGDPARNNDGRRAVPSLNSG